MKNKGNVTVNVTVKEGNESTSKLSKDLLDRVVKPGKSIFIMQPYNSIDPDDVDGEEIVEDDLKSKPIVGWSYAAIMVMASVLSDDLKYNILNGDYKIPLMESDNESTNKRLLVFTDEAKAEAAFDTLMTVSLTEVERREKILENIKRNLKEAKEKLFH
jgi:hypothetical protein